MKNVDLFQHENDFPDFDGERAVRHLSEAISFETTGYVDTARIRYQEFAALHDFLQKSFPLVFRNGILEKIGYSLLITLPGSDKSLKPALFMAHQDVVPVIAGTEKDWLHPPFSGDVADGFIWGRGAMDIKEMLIGILEAAEYHLCSGNRFRRTVYLAFGEDEETRSTGAIGISKLLKSRGEELEYVLDEGAGDVTPAMDYGAPGILVCPIGIYEKGYADLKLSAKSRGGHSSNPFRGTSLGVLSKAITAILDHPLPPHLPECVKSTLEQLAPDITEEPMAGYVRDIDHHTDDIINWFLARESLYHQVQTTAAPTQISTGAPSGNVMPQDMEAVINFRLAPPDTPASLLEHCRKWVDPGVETEYVQCIAPSTPSEIDSYGFHSLRKVLEHYFAPLKFIPVQNRGATDARHYEALCRCCLRFGPFLEEEDISAEGIHGTNERISVRAYLQGIRVLIKLMEETCL
ncbi:MAG: M20/M25/M40 family metallo-hydrolase [Agathobacter sp.]|nr:M20/M25/M40 family metallo-hydrolase [Agathobacter sp.]